MSTVTTPTNTPEPQASEYNVAADLSNSLRQGFAWSNATIYRAVVFIVLAVFMIYIATSCFGFTTGPSQCPLNWFLPG